jgi:hypothetical protein
MPLSMLTTGNKVHSTWGRRIVTSSLKLSCVPEMRETGTALPPG